MPLLNGAIRLDGPDKVLSEWDFRKIGGNFARSEHLCLYRASGSLDPAKRFGSESFLLVNSGARDLQRTSY